MRERFWQGVKNSQSDSFFRPCGIPQTGINARKISKLKVKVPLGYGIASANEWPRYSNFVTFFAIFVSVNGTFAFLRL
jgi:hypothetical protein